MSVFPPFEEALAEFHSKKGYIRLGGHSAGSEAELRTLYKLRGLSVPDEAPESDKVSGAGAKAFQKEKAEHAKNVKAFEDEKAEFAKKLEEHNAAVAAHEEATKALAAEREAFESEKAEAAKNNEKAGHPAKAGK